MFGKDAEHSYQQTNNMLEQLLEGALNKEQDIGTATGRLFEQHANELEKLKQALGYYTAAITAGQKRDDIVAVMTNNTTISTPIVQDKIKVDLI